MRIGLCIPNDILVIRMQNSREECKYVALVCVLVRIISFADDRNSTQISLDKKSSLAGKNRAV